MSYIQFIWPVAAVLEFEKNSRLKVQHFVEDDISIIFFFFFFVTSWFCNNVVYVGRQ